MRRFLTHTQNIIINSSLTIESLATTDSAATIGGSAVICNNTDSYSPSTV